MRCSILISLAAMIVLYACSDQSPEKPTSGASASAGKFDPNDPAYKKRVQAQLDEMKKEESVQEEAAWIGKTGLTEDDERELPRYLRREFGTLLSQPGSLKARDLEYLGVFVEGVETVRYWRINYGSPEAKFAYVVSAPADRVAMGWGNRKPPQ